MHENRPSLKQALFATHKEIPARTIVSSCLAGRFSVRLGSRFLAGPSCMRMGNRPAFFVSGFQALNLISAFSSKSGRCLVRRIANSPEAANAPVRLFQQPSKFFQPEPRSSGSIGVSSRKNASFSVRRHFVSPHPFFSPFQNLTYKESANERTESKRSGPNQSDV